MENMKRFAFLITDGDVILVNPVWHSSEIEAKNHLQKILSPIYSIIEDEQTISEFIEKEEMEISATPHSKLTDEYLNDLKIIKNSLNETKLNIDKKVAYLRKVLEMGADIDVRFHQCREKEEAEKIAMELQKMGQEFEAKKSNDSQIRWFKAYSGPVETTIYYDEKYLEEDVDLDGGEKYAV